MNLERRSVSTVLTGQEWGALDRWRESHGFPTMAAALRHLITHTTDDFDHLLGHASHMGDHRPITALGRDTPAAEDAAPCE